MTAPCIWRSRRRPSRSSWPGTRLNQLQLKAGEPPKLETRSVGVDLDSTPTAESYGFRGRRHAGIASTSIISTATTHRDFWEPLSLKRAGQLLLDPGELYILASSDDVEIPVDQAAEMTPIDPSVGEFRVHYAGFIDPGFGTDEAHGAGSKGVLEVRAPPPDAPFLLEHGQIVARLVYEPLIERPTRLYGEGGSHYQSQPEAEQAFPALVSVGHPAASSDNRGLISAVQRPFGPLYRGPCRHRAPPCPDPARSGGPALSGVAGRDRVDLGRDERVQTAVSGHRRGGDIHAAGRAVGAGAGRSVATLAVQTEPRRCQAGADVRPGSGADEPELLHVAADHSAGAGHQPSKSPDR